MRFSRSRTGRPVSIAPSAATAANPCGCISLPPKPPPMRRHCTVTRWFGMPSTCATISCVSDGCCVLALDEHLPLGVEVRERRVRLEVEVLLAADLADALEDVRRRRERGLGVAAADGARDALERVRRRSASGDRDERGERLVLDRARPRRRGVRRRPSRRAPTRGRGRGTSPRLGKSGSSCLTPASLTPGTSSAVSTRTTPGTSSAGATSSVTRACACSDCTGHAVSTSLAVARRGRRCTPRRP